MYPLGIVDGFDVLDRAQSNVLQSGVLLVMGPLLERAEESLYDDVIVTPGSLAHRAFDSQKLELRLISIACVLATAVAVMKQLSGLRLSRFDRVAKRFGNELRSQLRTQRPANDLAAEEIEHNRQVNPALVGGRISRIVKLGF